VAHASQYGSRSRRPEVEPGVALGVREGGDERGQRRLARRAGHRRRGGIHGVGAGGAAASSVAS
jgi:hypothetical protein